MKKIFTETKVAKTRILSMFLALLTILVTVFSPLFSPIEVHAFQEYPEEILVDIDMAQSSLEELLAEKDIYALVYLCDSYELKSAPDTCSDTVVSLNSGQFVQITGVNQDDYYYIWYEIQADVAGTVYTGYILRDYLAYSDEDLLNWEYDNVMSLSISLFSLAPIFEEDLNAVTIPEDIQAFPASYQDALLAMKAKHPNWIFVRMDTGVDWNTAITKENSGNRSLIHSANSNYLLTGSYDSSWSYPTNGFLAYYMDPRNFLEDNRVFMFESLYYNENYHTESAVQSILSGTFMDGAIPDDANGYTYAQAFCNIGKELKVSPFHLASRVRQEQGVQGTSALISGTHETYPDVYNYFNVGATGVGTKQNIETGLKKATEYGWTTRYSSLYGGANIIAKNYISTGQYTLYLQKFNVNKNSSYGLYNHQYMQNIKAPYTEAYSIRSAYATASSLDKPFVFSIPVYNNMPTNACPVPSSAKDLILGQTSYTLTADETVQMTFCLDGLVTNASAITFSSSNPEVASVSAQGVITAGNAGTATITCTAGDAASVTCTVTVKKATPVITIPALNAVTYSPEQTLADIILPEGWAWDNSTITPTVDNAGYPATYTPANTNKYEVTHATLSLTVNKGTPTYQIPEGLEAVEGNVLASLKLPVGFAWADGTVILEKTDSYPATYNPDEVNFETAIGIMIPVTVVPIEVECTEHTYGEWIVTTEASCGAKGERIRYCDTCLDEEKEELPALEHNYISSVIKEPTEEETGTRSFVCEFCDDSYTETIDKLPESHKHNYNAVVTTKETCTTAGVKTYTCSCGDVYTEPIAALGHSYSSKITQEPTEQEEGIRTYTCDNCKDSYTEKIAKLPETHKHSYAESITKQATCLEKGIKTFTCSCKDSYTEEITALGHDMANDKCRRCGYSEVTEDDTTVTPPDTTDDTNTPNTNTPDNGSTTTPGTSTTTPSTDTTTTPSTGTTTPSTSTTTPSTGTTTPSASTPTPSTSTSPSTTTPVTNINTSTPTAATTTTDESDETDDSDHFVATLNMENNTVLYKDTLSVVQGRDMEVVLQMNNQVKWTIQGSNISTDEAAGIDMGVRLNNSVIPADIMKHATKLSETNSVIEVSLAHDGPISFAPVLTIETNRANAGRIATLFYFNPEIDELEFQAEVEIAEDGSISFTFDHASDYAIVISESSIANYNTITATGALDINNPEPIVDNSVQNVNKETIESNDTSILLTNNSSPSTLIIIIAVLLLLVAGGIVVFIVSHQKTSTPNWDNTSERDSNEYSYDNYEDYDDSEEYYEEYDDDYDGDYDNEYSEEYEDDYADPVSDK